MQVLAQAVNGAGTLTTGELAVSRLMPLGDVKPAELLLIAASAEKYSNHPTAKALANPVASFVDAVTAPDSANGRPTISSIASNSAQIERMRSISPAPRGTVSTGVANMP